MQISSERECLQTSNLAHGLSTKTRIIDKRRDIQGQRSRSRDAFDRCWPISRECKLPETPKLVERLPDPRAILRTSFRVKRSKVKVTRSIDAETESVSPTNFKVGDWLVHALSTVTASYKGLWSWVNARGRGNTVSPHPVAASQLVITATVYWFWFSFYYANHNYFCFYL